MGEFALGQPVSRFEDLRLLRGGGRYVDDIVLPRMAFGYVLRSPHAHAGIRAIATDKAKAAPGVLAVLTGADWQASGFGDLPVPSGLKRRGGAPMYRPPYPALVKDRVRWVGDCVAFVVALTYAQAVDAAELIEVAYEPLPAIVSTADAISAGAPLVWEGCANNICFVHHDGDKAATDAAFARADHVIRHRLVINRVTAATMEPRGCIGDYNAAEDHYTIYSTLQRTHVFRSELAQSVLKLPDSKVRVIAGDIGGSFGMKSAVANEMALVLLASKQVARPVKWIGTRSESFLGDAQGRDNVADAELALDREGKFLGLRVRTILNLGAYLQMGGQTAIGNLGTLAGVYLTPAIDVEATAVFTHTNPMRPYRGNGRPEAAYIIERMVDLAADELGIAPAELRRRNMIPPEALPFKTGLTFTYDCGAFEKTMDMALDLAEFTSFESRRAAARGRGRLRGIGISHSIERAAAPGFEGAEIRFDRSGAATILSGSVTQGQGHETIYKQLVCDRFGLDPKDVHYVQGDTDKIFFGEGTGGSRSATTGGSALHLAAEKIVAKARAIAAHIFETDLGDVEFQDGVFSTPRTNRRLSIGEIARESLNPRRLPDGMEPGLVATAIYTAKVENFPNGCHVCELEIDTDTGIVEILRYSVVDDVGTVLNPLLLEGQICGGVAQGAGQALMEDIRFAEGSGQLLTGSFMDYAMPRADRLSAIALKSNPVPTRTNPLGVKGAGEAGCVGALPAVVNAVVDALSPLGIRHIEMPATSERIWRAMRQARPAVMGR
jgi:aerobic carbon-monoxide dehydrogenase large subunit